MIEAIQHAEGDDAHKLRSVSFEHELFDIYKSILDYGEERDDRTGTGTIATFGDSIRVYLQNGFPLVTTKRVPFKSIAAELLWFIEGSSDERRLAEILHGTRDPSKRTIWTPNAEGTTGAKYEPKFPGDLGRVYGVQWRTWQRFKQVVEFSDDNERHEMPFFLPDSPVDQLAEVIDKLKNKPTDRRIILSAWNPGELSQMALPPCHMFVQFYLSNTRELSCQMYQRSVDTFLGLPFNIASYALLMHLIAHIIDATPDVLTICLGDTHIYRNHIEQVKRQLTRAPKELPTLRINRKVSSIDDFKLEDLDLLGYHHFPAIEGEMSA